MIVKTNGTNETMQACLLQKVWRFRSIELFLPSLVITQIKCWIIYLASS